MRGKFLDIKSLLVGWTKAPNVYIFDYTLSADARFLYIVLLGLRMKDENVEIRGKQLQKITGWSKVKLWKVVQELENAGWLVVERRVGKPSIFRFAKRDPLDTIRNMKKLIKEVEA